AWRRRWGRRFVIAGGAALLLALGHWTPAYGALGRVLPLLAVVRYPEKLAAIAAIAFALVLAEGLTELARSPRRNAIVALLGLAVLVALSALNAGLDRPA